MLTLQQLMRQSSGGSNPLGGGLGVTLLPGCLLWLQGGGRAAQRALLRKIAGDLPVAEGHILFAGQETRGDPEFFADTHFVPQSRLAATPWMMAQRYLMRRAGGEDQPQLAEAALRYFGLSGVAGRPVMLLSASQRRCLALARLLTDPRAIWLLERPFDRLEPQAKEALEELIAGRCRQNGIVIFTHEGETRLNPHHRLDLADYWPEAA